MSDQFTVLGASGFIGKHLVASIRTSGRECRTPGRDQIASLEGEWGHVIYCVGLTGDAGTHPFAAARAHVGVLADVLERATFSSFLYLSSTRVYSRSQTAHEDEALAVAPHDPQDLFNITKLAGESLCHASGRPHVRIARLANVYGDDYGSQNFLFSVMRDAIEHGSVTLRTSPSSAKDYVSVDDVVPLLLKMTTAGRRRVYNVASGVNVTSAQILERLASLTGCTWEVAPGAPVWSFPRIDTERIREEFNFTPRMLLDDLENLINGYPAGH